jgi:hypothetical protein
MPTPLDQIIVIINEIRFFSKKEKDKWINTVTLIYEQQRKNEFIKIQKLFTSYKQKKDELDIKQIKLQNEYVSKTNRFLSEVQKINGNYNKKAEEYTRTKEDKYADNLITNL